MKKIIAISFSFLLILATIITVSAVTTLDSYTELTLRTHKTILDFEESSYPKSMLEVNGGGAAVNTDKTYIKTGNQSASITLGGTYTNFKAYGSAGDFVGDGVRFYFSGDTALGSSAKMYLRYTDGSTSNVIEIGKPTNNAWNEIYYNDYDSVTEDLIPMINGIQVNFNNGTATGAVYYIDCVQVINPPVEKAATFKNLSDFEDVTLSSSVIAAGNATAEINTDATYVNTGAKSVKVTCSKAWSNVKMYGTAGDFIGDGIKFYTFGEGSLSSADLYLIIDGTSVKQNLRPTVNGWTVIDYATLGISAEDQAKITGIHINFNNSSANNKVYYFDSVQIVNSASNESDVNIIVANFEEANLSSSVVTVGNGTLEINTDITKVYDGMQSAKVSLTKAWSNVKMYGGAGDFVGAGIKFYIFGDGSLSNADLYLIIDGTSVKQNLRPTVNGWTVIDYATLGISAENQAKITGVHINFNNSSAKDNVYYFDSLEVINHANTPEIESAEIAVAPYESVNGRLSFVGKADVTEGLVKEGFVVIPTALLGGNELTIDTALAVKSEKAAADTSFKSYLINEKDYSDTMLTVRAYTVYENGKTYYSAPIYCNGISGRIDNVKLGDANNDTDVDIRDLVATHISLESNDSARLKIINIDLNVDGKINVDDMTLLRKCLLEVEDYPSGYYISDMPLVANW